MISSKSVIHLIILATLLFGWTFCKDVLEKPNVLFLVIEDASPYLFPAYGNETINTPNLDFLAANGVVYDNAFANAPYCSPARSTLVSGTIATVYGNDIHREGHIQAQRYFLPKILKDAGYFTVNKGKTDYNITGKQTLAYMQAAWSMNGGNASYNDSLRRDKPFFAQYNNASTHMSRLTTVTYKNRLKSAVDTHEVVLPPHVPDLPAMRADYALHLEGVQNIDKWVGLFLHDLKERQLLENTIIFFFSDHGGCLPRGKAFPFDTGHRVPLIISVPDKFQHLLPAERGTRSDRLVSFDDFIPTVISIAGQPIPESITGLPFMGEYKAPRRQFVHAFRTNTAHHFDPSRSVFDGRFHYIRYYTPYKKHAMTQWFQWQMPSQLAWDQHFMDGKTSPVHSKYYEPHPVEALYDLESDPWELNNLVNRKEYDLELKSLRKANEEYIRSINDLGLISREARADLTEKGHDFYTWVRENVYPLKELITLAEVASDGNTTNLSTLVHQARNIAPLILVLFHLHFGEEPPHLAEC